METGESHVLPLFSYGPYCISLQTSRLEFGYKIRCWQHGETFNRRQGGEDGRIQCTHQGACSGDGDYDLVHRGIHGLRLPRDDSRGGGNRIVSYQAQVLAVVDNILITAWHLNNIPHLPG